MLVPELRFEGRIEHLQAHVGIATGLVVTGEVIGNARREHAFSVRLRYWPHIPEARRSGMVVVSSDTGVSSESCSNAVGRCRRAGGPFEPLDASLVLRESTIAGRLKRFVGRSFTLLGRDEELDLLMRRWEQAKDGSAVCRC